MKKKHIFSQSHEGYRAKLEQRRMKAAKFFGEGKSQADVARLCKVSPEAARQWYHAWRRHRRAGLRSRGRPGPPARVSEVQIQRVLRALKKGPHGFGHATDVWTLERIRQVIRSRTGVVYDPSQVWHILRAHDWSCQKPQARARERDEAAIEHWRKVIWPRIQKKGEKSMQILAF